MPTVHQLINMPQLYIMNNLKDEVWISYVAQLVSYWGLETAKCQGTNTHEIKGQQDVPHTKKVSFSLQFLHEQWKNPKGKFSWGVTVVSLIYLSTTKFNRRLLRCWRWPVLNMRVQFWACVHCSEHMHTTGQSSGKGLFTGLWLNWYWEINSNKPKKASLESLCA